MNICQAPLADSFNKTPFELWIPYLFGLLGIWGWGLAFEFLFRKRLNEFSALHAFLEGTVLVSFILLFLSVLGLAGVAWPVAISGIFLGALSRVLAAKQRQSINPVPKARVFWEASFVVFLALPAAFCLVVKPLWLGDTSSIWGYHAKVLTCFPLFEANFVREKVWAGTHPEYPLFLSFLHSFFFTLSNSFRDDWIKIWQGISLIVTVPLAYFEIKKGLGRKLHAFSAVVVVLCALSQGLLQGTVELNAAAFIWLACIALLVQDRWRMSVYLAGFLFCKNEGMVGSVFFVALILGGSLVKSSFDKLAIQERKTRWSQFLYLAPWVVLGGFWLLILSRLPSLHEQYPTHLVSLAAWKKGMGQAVYILSGCLESLRTNRDYRYLMLSIPVLTISLLSSRRLRRDPVFEAMALPLVWGLGMLGLFLAVYIVSPWGPDLYTITLQRIFIEIYPAFAMSLVIFAAILMKPDSGKLKVERLGYSLQVLTIVYFSVSLKNNSLGLIENVIELYRKQELGLVGYQRHPEWSEALGWDRKLPIAGRGAILHPKRYYFTPNYMLFPRVLYPTDPSIIAGTVKPWSAWESSSEVPTQKLGLSFIVDGETNEILLPT